jgi:surface protein
LQYLFFIYIYIHKRIQYNHNMPTFIMNENIREYVLTYIIRYSELPVDLKKKIGNWDVSMVTNMSGLFKNTYFNEDISGWDVSNVTDMHGMFLGATEFNKPIGKWNVSKVTDMYGMFLGATEFNQPIGEWNVSNVTDMREMFEEATSFNHPIGEWDVSKVTDMKYMFEKATSFNQPIGKWNVSKVTDMSYMFRGATSFNQPIGEWNTSKVTNMGRMFEEATSFNQPIGEWDVSKVTNMRMMFKNATSFNQPIGEWDVSNVTDMEFMFDGATSFNHPRPLRRAVPLINAITGSLHNNNEYIPSRLPVPQFPVVSNEWVDYESMYFDIIDGEEKNVLNDLVDAFAFKAHDNFYVISETDMKTVMNDPDFIKYECPNLDSMATVVRSVPYVSVTNMGIVSGGVVPLFQLWTATHSPNTPNKVRTYKLVKTDRKLVSTVSHNVLYNASSRISASHCQAGQDMYVYDLYILPVLPVDSSAIKIQRVFRRYQSQKKKSAEKMNKSAIKLQSIVRGHFSRKSNQNGSKKLSTRGRSNSEGSSRLSGGGKKKMKSVKRIKRLRRVRRISRR